MNFMLIAFEAGYKFDNGKCQRPTQKINVLKKFNKNSIILNLAGAN